MRRRHDNERQSCEELRFLRPRSNCLKNCLNRRATQAKARVALKRIQILSILARKNMGKNFASSKFWQRLHQTLLIKIYVTRSRYQISCKSFTHGVRSTTTRDVRQILLGLRLRCCFYHMRSKKIVSLKPPLQIAASNRIQGTSPEIYENKKTIPHYH